MVTFPGLNLNLEIEKIAIQMGNIKITWYAILIVASFVIALIAYKKIDGKYGIKYSDVLDLAIYLIPISVVSARLYYVLFNINYYSRNLSEIIDFTSGGLAIYGGIIGRNHNNMCIL